MLHPRFTAFTATLAVAASFAQAAVSIDTVGTYDGSSTPSNTVDANVGSSDVDTFTDDVLAAFNTDTGGVINFDGLNTTADPNGGLENTGPINATFGASQSKTLEIGVETGAANDQFNFQSSSNVSQISGTDFFFNQSNVAGNNFTTFSFDGITGGDAGEVVNNIGFTVLGRSSGDSTNVSATATFSDLSTATLGPVTYPAGDGFASRDSFFEFTAPTGASISSVTITYGNNPDTGTNGDTRRGIDDFGFITIPEPASLALLGMGGLMLLPRRSRPA